ncbi:MAG: sarcosine oxidase subunit gamma family protein [Casimicrobiaceae bacterium]
MADLVILAEATIAAAWNMQGDPADAPFVDEVQRLFGIALPVAPHTIVQTDPVTAVWLGPSSWLLVAGGASPLADFTAKRDALNAIRGALFDVSASRIAWTVSGPRSATVLAKGCPLDFHPRVFAAGMCAQSLLGHVNALFIKHDDTPTFTVMVARSYARDVWHALREAAAQYGFDVRPPSPYR